MSDDELYVERFLREVRAYDMQFYEENGGATASAEVRRLLNLRALNEEAMEMLREASGLMEEEWDDWFRRVNVLLQKARGETK